MPVFEITLAARDGRAETVTIEDDRDLERIAMALVDNGFIATQEVRVISTGIEYQGRTNEYSAVEPVGQIALFSNSVTAIRQLELPAEG